MLKEIELLKKISSSSTCPHAFLFVGASGVGKFETAINFAKFLNCKNGKFGSYNDKCDCEQCLSIDKSIHPDVYIIEKQEGKKEITDSQIIDKEKKEGVIYKINNNPILGKYNVVIIKNAELMNKTVSNTILKSLEEPKNHTIFILTTTNKDSILKTIISRCLIIQFSLLNKVEIHNIVVNKEKEDLISDLSSLKYERIIQLNNEEVLNKYVTDIKDFGNILRSKDFEKIAYINKILENKEDLNYYVYIWELVFDFCLLGKHLDLIGDIKLLNIGESIKKLYNLKNAISGNYILKIGLINFLLDIN